MPFLLLVGGGLISLTQSEVYGWVTLTGMSPPVAAASGHMLFPRDDDDDDEGVAAVMMTIVAELSTKPHNYSFAARIQLPPHPPPPRKNLKHCPSASTLLMLMASPIPWRQLFFVSLTSLVICFVATVVVLIYRAGVLRRTQAFRGHRLARK